MTIRQVQRTALLDCLIQPRTYNDVADMLGVTYHTARRWVIELQESGLVVELPTRGEGGKVLFRRLATAEPGQIIVAIDGDYLSVGDATARSLEVLPDDDLLKVAMSYLGYIYTRSFYKSKNHGLEGMAPERAREGTIEPVEVKERLRAGLKAIDQIKALIEQALLDDRIWSDNLEVHQNMAPIAEYRDRLLQAGEWIMLREDARRRVGNG